MHRSGSTTRASDFFLSGTPGRVSSPGQRLSMEMDQLPTYDPQSTVAKKEALKIKSAENAVHLIPLVLILCGILLWFFSNPQIDVLNKGDSIAARIKNMTIDGYSNITSSSSLALGVEDLDVVDQSNGLDATRRTSLSDERNI